MHFSIVRHAGVIAALAILSLAAARADTPWAPGGGSGPAMGAGTEALSLAYDYDTATFRSGPGGAHPEALPEAAPDPDLDALENGLRRTDAIGIVTKIRLQNRFDALLGDLYRRHQGGTGPDLAVLSGRYESLMDLTMSLVRRDDPALHRRLADARRGLWLVMADARKFAAAELYTPDDPDDTLGR